MRSFHNLKLTFPICPHNAEKWPNIAEYTNTKWGRKFNWRTNLLHTGHSYEANSNISRELGTRQPRNKHTINRTNFRVMFKPLGTGGKVGRNLQKILSFMRENSLNLKADASLALWSCLCLSGRPPLNGPQLDFSE